MRKLHGVTVVDEPAVCSVWYVCGLEAPREEELPTVDEEISLPVLVDEKDEKFFDPQLVFEGKWREVETLEEYDSFEVVTQEESKRLVRDEGGKEISTRWGHHASGWLNQMSILCARARDLQFIYILCTDLFARDSKNTRCSWRDL